MLHSDPVMLLFLGFLVVLFFFTYLLLRRTLMGFKEGMERGKR